MEAGPRGQDSAGVPRGWQVVSGKGQDGSCAASLQVNRTFEELALLRDIQEVWGVLGPQLFDFMNNSANVAILQVG